MYLFTGEESEYISYYHSSSSFVMRNVYLLLPHSSSGESSMRSGLLLFSHSLEICRLLISELPG